MVELGGGSVEIGLVDETRVRWSETHAMGAVSLMEMFTRGNRKSEGFSRLIQEYVATNRLPVKVAERGGAKGFIATGGGIKSEIARISGEARGEGRNGSPLASCAGDVGAFRGCPLRSAGRFGLRADRADVIVPAAIVYERLAETLAAVEMLVPGGGVREGIVFDLMERIPRSIAGRTGDRASGRAGDASYVRRDPRPPRRAPGRFPLRPAARRAPPGCPRTAISGHGRLLHDVVVSVSLKGHHKHALYLIARSELPGFTPKEMVIIGTIARYHRKAPPLPSTPSSPSSLPRNASGCASSPPC